MSNQERIPIGKVIKNSTVRTIPEGLRQPKEQLEINVRQINGNLQRLEVYGVKNGDRFNPRYILNIERVTP